jgi:AcrR family transcriptional regulator
MSPRPRRSSDVEILMAAFRAIARLGPHRLTLADVAREAGLTASALVQRFGSKRALLLAAAADAAGGDAYIFPALRQRYRSPRAALLGLADCMTMMGETPEQVAHSLAFLQMDLTDPEFRSHAVRRSRGMHAGLRALVEDAIAAGELGRCDARRLARALEATLTGSMLAWTFHREGTLATWLRRDLRTVIAPYEA